ncbi:DUF4410 domain-containing protein [Acidisphaera rubrifaciens]|uniref:DUF4410 domain-containing protein n=1 Tax=Acidisphaera rubrifaciens HS-AP3 TaxID=1231350 RepID=A0A0D6P270_9PROT|nr:DUF4410 domain-containing protein [Acidisphaera rubrifaciens]GAN75855.1 hypothetical protein Asru_0010_03 [Acidisphaera rubrifaciens HS-AP3]
MRRASLLAVLLLAACARGHVTPVATAPAAGTPAPMRVLVTDFAVSPAAVHLDSGLAARLMRSGSSVAAQQEQQTAAETTQAALRRTLVAKLQSYGLPAEYLPPGYKPPPRSALVQGHILAINEGNRTRRTVVGLGAGKSSVAGDAQLTYVGAGGTKFLAAFSGSADSGRMPGAAETMGVGAAAGSLGAATAVTGGTHALAETRRTTNEANADQLADALARQIADYAASQGWIARGAGQ